MSHRKDVFPAEIRPYLPEESEVPHHSDNGDKQSAFRHGWLMAVGYKRLMGAEGWPEAKREYTRQMILEAQRHGAKQAKMQKHSDFEFAPFNLIQN